MFDVVYFEDCKTGTSTNYYFSQITLRINSIGVPQDFHFLLESSIYTICFLWLWLKNFNYCSSFTVEVFKLICEIENAEVYVIFKAPP